MGEAVSQGAAAILNLGLPETIVIGVVALLLFGPSLGRLLGNVGGTVLKFKRDVDDTKQGVYRRLEDELDSALRDPQPKPPPPPPGDESPPPA